MTEPKWPEKKVCTKDCYHSHGYKDCTCWVWNACHDAFMKVIEAQPNIQSCKCQRHSDSAFTVIQLDEGLLKCPSCGGIIVAQPQGLLPLDVELMTKHIEYWWGSPNFNLRQYLYTFTQPPKAEIMSVKIIELFLDYMKDVESGIKYLEQSNKDYGYGKDRLRSKAQAIHQRLTQGK